MLESYDNFEYVDPKDWNNKLFNLNGRKRARYFILRYYSKEPIDITQKSVQIEPYVGGIPMPKIYYTVKSKLDPEDGFYEHNIKIADDLKVELSIPRLRTTSARVLSALILCKDELSVYSFTPKITEIPKDVKNRILDGQELKDMYGVIIEPGDFVAHASSTADLSIFEATIFGIGTVEGLKPNKMAVVKTKNPNKKLGWL